jgi:hypothetical protein
MRMLARPASVAVIGTLLLLAPAASARQRSDVDRAARVAVTLDGASVTFAASAATPRAVLTRLRAGRLQVLCASGRGAVPGPLVGEPGEPADFDFSAVGRAAMWPTGSDTLEVALPRDISEVAGVCLITSAGGEPVVTGVFDPALKRAWQRAAARDARAALRQVWIGARTVAANNGGRLPGARALAAAIDRSGQDVAFATAVSGVEEPGPVYVIGRGTTPRSLLLATEDRAGSVHRLRWRAGERRPRVT